MAVPMFTEAGTGQYVASENHYAVRGAVKPSRRGVLIHGGRGQTALGNMPPDKLTNMLVADGMRAMYFDCSNGRTWGSDTGKSRVTSALAYLSTLGAPSDKYVLYGSSMGGAVMLNWAIANPTKVACILLVIPAVDIGDIYDNNTTSTLGFTAATDIDTAYGGTAAFAAARASHNPVLNASALSAIPILNFYSGNDPVCRPATQTAFAAAVGANCTLVNMGNYGHGSSGDPAVSDQAAAFVARYAA